MTQHNHANPAGRSENEIVESNPQTQPHAPVLAQTVVFVRHHALRILLSSAAVLAPVFWRRTIAAGDLGSHLYNAWLAQLIRHGYAPGLCLVPRWNNVLFDLLLSGLGRFVSLHAAEKIAVSLAVFAPEHFGGPMRVADMVPSWMPAHWFWAYLVGCALFAAATSLTVRKFVSLSSTLLGLMFFLFVCMMHIPNALADPKNRFAWAYALRDLSFAGGAWALAGRIVIAIAAIFFAVEFFLHPEFAPGFPLEKITPSWVPFPSVWG